MRAAPGAVRPDRRARDSVLRALDFAEEGLGRPIGVADLARTACYSAFYFSRLFALATGHAPYDYLMRRRVAAAAEAVVGGEGSLTEIALEHGFEAPESFARAFRRCFGLLPSEARRAGSFPRRIARTRIGEAYVEALLEGAAAPPSAEEGPELLLAGGWDEGRLGGAAPRGGASLALVERDEGLAPRRSLVGSAMPAGSAPPPFPRAAAALAAGRRARFALPLGPSSLGAVVEFAYRAWLPQAFPGREPGFDLVELGERGAEALVLPLGPG